MFQGWTDSIHGNLVFKQWARAWSKRTIIQNAVKMMAPVPEQPAAEAVSTQMQIADEPENPLVALVMQWATFERFVFVMSVLEGYSIRECSVLLACRDQDVITAKSLVLQRLANKMAQAPSAFEVNYASWNGLSASAQMA